MRVLAAIAICSVCVSSITISQSRAADDVTPIRAAADHFLGVFDNLDWEPFRAAWSSEPTVFFPFDDTPERVTGRAAVDARFRRFFDSVKAKSPGPPYLNLKPRELRVERHGDTGIVTFMLGGPGRVSRRTLVFVRQDNTWKVAHLHASIAGQP